MSRAHDPKLDRDVAVKAGVIITVARRALLQIGISLMWGAGMWVNTRLTNIPIQRNQRPQPHSAPKPELEP